MKIAIGTPEYGVIKTKTVDTLLRMTKLPYEFIHIFRYGAYISENKEEIIKIALEQKCDYLFFVDYDIIFNYILLQELLDEEKDIIGGMYNYRKLPKEPMIKLFPDTKASKDTFKVAALGGGCLLVKTDVFRKMGKPYFPMEYKDGKVVCTEDIGFCEKARKSGYDIWCYPKHNIKHIGEFNF